MTETEERISRKGFLKMGVAGISAALLFLAGCGGEEDDEDEGGEEED